IHADTQRAAHDRQAHGVEAGELRPLDPAELSPGLHPLGFIPCWSPIQGIQFEFVRPSWGGVKPLESKLPRSLLVFWSEALSPPAPPRAPRAPRARRGRSAEEAGAGEAARLDAGGRAGIRLGAREPLVPGVRRVAEEAPVGARGEDAPVPPRP